MPPDVDLNRKPELIIFADGSQSACCVLVHVRYNTLPGGSCLPLSSRKDQGCAGQEDICSPDGINGGSGSRALSKVCRKWSSN